LLSRHLSNLSDVAEEHQGIFFSEDPDNNPHTKVTWYQSYPVALPMYPFRTLCPRELTLQKLTPCDFDVASPLLPGNTQLNITLKRRKPPKQQLASILATGKTKCNDRLSNCST
jgi:hypothetical protein